MRISCGILVAAMLVALSQPALAVCIYRGLAKMCQGNPTYEKSGGASKRLMINYADPPAVVPSDLKTIVLQPIAQSGDAAWVLTRPDGDAAPACEPGLSC